MTHGWHQLNGDMKMMAAELICSPKNVGENLREIRLSSGLARAVVAERLGLAHSSLHAIESGARQPKIETIAAMLRLYAEAMPSRQSEEVAEGRPWPETVNAIAALWAAFIATLAFIWAVWAGKAAS